uniref:Reverse transcriptase domain-containing protein n=2 Tax=Cannabis sativa TaxID=3483 RepID=A0A803NZ18_CANSA
MASMGVKDIQVESVDEEMNNTLVRDGAIEMELLELFEDITLEEVVVNKACVGKIVGCKDMPASVVKKILTGVWRRLGPWKMKKCEEGVLGFFFHNEEDCAFVLQKRPWLVNGVLLNIKPWPVEGEVRTGEFAVARFWVQIHGLPTRCLTNDNAEIVAKKIGELAETDGSSKAEVVRRGYLRMWVDVWVAHPIPAGFFLKSDGKPESWVQFKYEKLPMLCFNCGKLAHWDKICHAPMTMITPRSGKAVPLYGLWIKSDTGNSNCFNSKGKGVLKWELEEIPEWELQGRSRRGVWNRKSVKASPGGEVPSEKGKQSGGDTAEPLRQSKTMKEKGQSYIAGTSSGSVAPASSTMIGTRNLHVAMEGDHEVFNVPGNILNLPNPDFANNQHRDDLIPDLGPTLAQCIDIPHEWVCLSQNPHSFPEACPISWPNHDSEAQKVFMQLYKPDFLNLYKAQQSLLSIPPNLSEMINHLLGNNRKRKAHTLLQPIPAISTFSSSENLSQQKLTEKTEAIPQEAFCIGVGDEASSSRPNGRGRKSKGSSVFSTRRSSGVKTRSGRKKCPGFWKRRGGGRTHAPTVPMRCLSWNCRGLRRPAAERTLRGLVRESNADLIFLSETKVDEISMIQVVVRLGFENHSCIPAKGLAGGFCVAWKSGRGCSISQIFEAGFCIRIMSLGCSEPWFLFCMYGTPYPALKNEYWDWLTNTVKGCNANWAVMGDLNVIMNAEEKEGGKQFHDKEGELLRDFLFDTGGIDLGCEGGCTTWQNSRNARGRIRKRLDRVVAKAEWCIDFQNAKVVKFPILGSDHAPICLQTLGDNLKLRYPFRFLEVWTSHPDCERVVKGAWNQSESLLVRKLARTKWELKKWNQEVFGFCDRKLVSLRHQLGEIQRDIITQENVQREAEVQLEILEMEGRMDRIWRQKSRENWIRFGDANSKFFHSSTIINRRRNFINSVEVSPGVWSNERDVIGGYFNDHFLSLFESSGSTIGVEFEPLFVEKVTEEDNDFMGRLPEVEEIREVVFKLHPLKAPGPDGFPGIFYRKYWHTVGPQLCTMVREFFTSGVLDKKINHAFICLIPKKVQASEFDHFRPISLCNFSYKVISRILTDRIKVVIDRLISPCQSAFMPGRWIAEASIMAQEVLHSIKNKKGKVGAMAIKTDMSKAYDRLEWDFISHVLEANGFSSKVCNLIMQCITTVRFSILLNGAPLAPFNPKRGIRQGDPLSPFIFILCSEVLSKLILKEERLGQLSGVRIARNSTPISHLFYADDSIFFCNATVANSENLLNCIRTYEEWSGQRVNKQKSGLVFSPNTPRSCREEIKQKMGIGCLNSSEKYLGNPFFFSANKRRDFQFIKEKITNRLEGWKARQLAQAGRSVLINSVLQTIPNYCMSTAVVPLTLCNELDRILARFWWRGNSEKNRYCALKSWNDLCQPKACGGLGFRRLADMNVALLAKLFWMVLKEEDKLWVQLLRDKYCRIMSPWNVEKKDMDSRGWKSILEARKVCLEGAGLLVADGNNDIWDRPWVPHMSMEELKYGFQIRPNHSCWQIKDLFENGMRASKSGKFSVKSAYWLSQRHRFKEPSKMWSSLWRTKVHPRLQLLCWKIFSDSLPTKGRIGLCRGDQLMCSFCHSSEETTLHLFFKCQVVRSLWFRSGWGLRSDRLNWNSLKDCGDWWCSLTEDNLIVFAACVWDSLWKWRNEVIHKGRTCNVEEIYGDCMRRYSEFQSTHFSPNVDVMGDLGGEKPHQNVNLVGCRFRVDASVVEEAAGFATVFISEDQPSVVEAGLPILKSSFAVSNGPVYSVLEGELHGIKLALLMAKESGLESVIIETDSKVAVRCSKSGHMPFCWDIYPLFCECLRLCKNFHSCVVSFIPREQNLLADKLAKWARECSMTKLSGSPGNCLASHSHWPLPYVILIIKQLRLEHPTAVPFFSSYSSQQLPAMSLCRFYIFQPFSAGSASPEDGAGENYSEFQRWHNGGGTFHKSAQIDPSASVDIGAVVHSKAVVGAHVHIGSGAIIGPSVTIGQSTKIGYNVALSNCTVGDLCVIHNGVCIGQDGFGFLVDEHGNMLKKPQMLNARIGSNVEIGANSCIDRGSWRDTVVGDHSKIDNLVQIAHNVVIGKCCMLCGQVGIAGSVTVGDYVTMGGRVLVRDHVSIASKVRLAGASCVTKDITEPGDYGGFPAVPIHEWRRQVIMHRLAVKKKNP